MSQRPLPGNLPGVINTIDSMINFLSDPKRVKENLEMIKREHQRLSDQIELVGKAKEIPKLLGSAREKDENAKEALEKAKKLSTEMVEAAQKEADLIEKLAKARDKESDELANKISKDFTEERSRLTARMAGVEAMQADLEKKLLNATHLEQNATTIEERLMKREAALKKAMA